MISDEVLKSLRLRIYNAGELPIACHSDVLAIAYMAVEIVQVYNTYQTYLKALPVYELGSLPPMLACQSDLQASVC